MRTLRGKILLGITTVIIISFLIINSLVLYVLNKNLEKEILSNLTQMKEIAWGQLEGDVLSIGSLATLSRRYEAHISFEGNKNLFAGKVLNKELKEKILTESNEESALTYIDKNKEYYEATYVYPFYKDNHYEGSLVIQKDYTPQYRNYEKIVSQIILIEIFVFIGMFICIYYWLTKATKKLTYLQKGMKKVEQGDFTQEVVVRGKDEIASLALAFNTMQEKIAYEMKSTKDFFNYATHEIKTPLTAIKGYSQLLEGETLEEARVKAMAERIGIEAERMYKLVENMLVVARGQQVEEKKEWVNLKALLEECVEEYDLIIKQKEKQIELLLEEGQCYVNKEEIRRVYKNLIDNSIKYSVGNLIKIQMEAGEEVKITFCNKIGKLPKHIEDELLNPFIKYQYGDYEKVSSGLGLFICKELMIKNNGAITYDIEEDNIYFTLIFR